jgi:DNA invertase Pin-like site-specific DNA recombinase
MSKHHVPSLELAGVGAAYIRVSTDQQETVRQYAALHAFEERHGITIKPEHWFKDEGWARDTADQRPDFRRLMQLAECGAVNWIVVSERDRFGTADAHEFLHFLYQLRKWGCRLFDAADTDWTKKDIATVITAVVDGEKSELEQISLSKRVLGAMIEGARRGEWQGGAVRLGFDIACYPKESGEEKWRVILEGGNKRLKVYPDGKEERFDGQGRFPKWYDETEVLKLTPSRDQRKIDVAVSLFKRFATESISFTALAQYVRKCGFDNWYGHHVEALLGDPIYIGYYTWNRKPGGKFNRFKDGQVIQVSNHEQRRTKNSQGDWVQSHRLFEPLIDLETWKAVQSKLANRQVRAKAPRSAALYLSGLVYCSHCGSRMVAGPNARGLHFVCGSWHRAAMLGKLAESKCLRNGVEQEVLQAYIDKYLAEIGHRLELLTKSIGTADPILDRLKDQEGSAWQAFSDGLHRLCDYLAEYHPEDYDALLREYEGYDLRMFTAAAVDFYEANFNPARFTAKIDQLQAEHDELMTQWSDLPTKLAKEKAQAKFASLESQIEELRKQQENAADLVMSHYRQMNDLQLAIVEAQRALQGEATAQALRRRAEAIRAIVHRIEVAFRVTGLTGGGRGRKSSVLATVTIYPVVGDEFTAHIEKGLQPTRGSAGV